jgi:ribonuclease HI/ADP-ribose pyrophosphatase YjhB (NUDIX family)
MNQRISARAVIKKNGKILLLRRANGRPSILGKYELPGGKLEYGEQLGDSLARYLHDDAGLIAGSISLTDVLAYIDHDDRDIQYVFVLYVVDLGLKRQKVLLSHNYDHYLWREMSDIRQSDLTESTKLLLGISQHLVRSVKIEKKIENDVSSTTNIDHVIIYSDGGSRGNPGPSASGFIIMDSRENILYEGGIYLGITTNNQAEYHGVRLGLEKALAIGAKTADVRIDSLLVVNQMNGIYKIKNREIWPINERIRDLIVKFDKVTFSHVKREYNQLADGMVNKILDAHMPD